MFEVNGFVQEKNFKIINKNKHSARAHTPIHTHTLKKKVKKKIWRTVTKTKYKKYYILYVEVRTAEWVASIILYTIVILCTREPSTRKIRDRYVYVTIRRVAITRANERIKKTGRNWGNSMKTQNDRFYRIGLFPVRIYARKRNVAWPARHSEFNASMCA